MRPVRVPRPVGHVAVHLRHPARTALDESRRHDGDAHLRHHGHMALEAHD